MKKPPVLYPGMDAKLHFEKKEETNLVEHPTALSINPEGNVDLNQIIYITFSKKDHIEITDGITQVITTKKTKKYKIKNVKYRYRKEKLKIDVYVRELTPKEYEEEKKREEKLREDDFWY